MQTSDSTAKATILNYFPERIQAALRTYGAEISLPPESVVQSAIGYFLESAEINVSADKQDSSDVPYNQGLLTHLPYSMQKGVEQYAAEYEFPPEFVVELAVTFLLDPDASSFEDCHLSIQKEQIYLLQQYREDHQAEAA